jgi:hypothetical protein
MKAVSRLNAEWHKANKMPPSATTTQRIRWHKAHEEHCACRPIPEKLRALILKTTKGQRTQSPDGREIDSLRR